MRYDQAPSQEFRGKGAWGGASARDDFYAFSAKITHFLRISRLKTLNIF